MDVLTTLSSSSSSSDCNSNVSLRTPEHITRRKKLHEATSYHASPKGKCKRRKIVRVLIRRKRTDHVSTIGFPLGMSFAAVMAEVLYRRDAAAAHTLSPTHISLVFGDKLDGLTRNFEQSFTSTLSTLRLIYESSTSNEGNHVDTRKMEFPNFKLTLDKGDCSSDSVIEDGNSEGVLHEDIHDQSNNCKEVEENFHLDSVNHDLTLHRKSNQMVSFSPISCGSGINNSMMSVAEKSVMEKSRLNDLKTLELALAMKKLKLKETQLVLNSDLNHLERSKLAMGMSKASFKVEKFKNQLEDLRHGELIKKCIDSLIAGLLVMSSSLLYGAYVYSYERIAESTASCSPPIKESKSWWTPKSMISFDSKLHVLWCQVQVMSRMAFGILMIFAIAYLLIQRSTTTSQTMPVTFILLLLGVACGYCGKLCIDTLGGNGSVWLLYWEILCMLHFLSIVCTPTLFQILHGPVIASQKSNRNVILPYWFRRFWFYATLLVFLPLFCGLIPFAGFNQWKDHFLFKVSIFDKFK
ncbi:protein CPR-5-like isoform X2 [Cicer arietinum]|uniref:Protein CPR-5-like isoform X2 n=1 Tax=Cicer arietinum TaxID=3827 RepID=A0A3Q7Y1C0_CICAR|nr:protein CPR-5-like isoform X2 [Cicer arietinum]